MVKGEHLRPLVGFVVVCGVAALILTTGLTDPAALRRIVSAQRVLPSSDLTELVLGQTFGPTPRQTAGGVAGGVAGRAAEPELFVLASPAPVAPRSHRASHPTQAGSVIAQNTHVAPVQPAQAAPAVAEAPSSEPVSTPAPTTPATPITPVRGVVPTTSTHQSAKPSGSADSSRGHARHHASGHSRGGEDRHQAHGSDDRHQTHQVRPAHAGPSAVAPTSSAADSTDPTGFVGSPRGHDHSDHAHGDHSHDHSRGHGR